MLAEKSLPRNPSSIAMADVISREISEGTGATTNTSPSRSTDSRVEDDCEKPDSSKPTPLPMRFTLPLQLVVLCDAVSLTYFFPFLPDQCRNRFGIPEASVGNAVGLLCGSLNLAVFFSSPTIGHLSDKWGRKPPVIVGLSASLVGSLCLVLAPNFWFAFFALFCTGLLNSNFAVCKAGLADVTDESNRGIAFAYQGAAFMFARSFSSAIGGAGYGVAPFGISIFEDNPFLFPGLIASGLALVTMGVVVIFMKETNAVVLERRRAKKIRMATVPVEDDDVEAVKEDGETSKKTTQRGMIAGLRAIGSDKEVVRICVITCLNSFCNGGFLTALILFMTLGSAQGGLGLSPAMAGYMFVVFSTAGFIFQMFVFKRISRLLGLRMIYRMGASTLCIGCILICFVPWFSHISGEDSGFWVEVRKYGMLCSLLAFASCGFMTMLPVLGAMMANVADPEIMGLSQGTANSLASLSRAFGPLATGAISAAAIPYGIPYAAFLLPLATGFFCQLCLSFGICPKADGKAPKVETEKARAIAGCDGEDSSHEKAELASSNGKGNHRKGKRGLSVIVDAGSSSPDNGGFAATLNVAKAKGSQGVYAILGESDEEEEIDLDGLVSEGLESSDILMRGD